MEYWLASVLLPFCISLSNGLVDWNGVARPLDGFLRSDYRTNVARLWGTEPAQVRASPWIQGAQQARGFLWSDIRANAGRLSSSSPLVGPQAVIASPWISMQDSAELAGTQEGSPWSSEPQQSSASPCVSGAQQSMATPWVTGAQQSSGSPWVVGTQQSSGTPWITGAQQSSGSPWVVGTQQTRARGTPWINPPSAARSLSGLPQEGTWSTGPQQSSASPWIV